MDSQKSNNSQEYGIFLDKPFTFDRFIRLLLTIAIIIGLIVIIRSISGVLIPFFIALMLAYLTDPIVAFFQNKLRIKHRGISVFLTMLLFIGTFTGILMWLIPQFVSETVKLITLVQKFLQTHSLQALLPEGVYQWLNQVLASQNFQEFLGAQDVSQLTTVILNSAKSVFTGSLSILFGVVGLLMILLYLFFILLDYKKIEEGWQSLIPQKHRHLAITISNDLRLSMRVYFRAQFTIALIVGILLAIGFSIIDMPMAVTLGLFIGMLNIVPYLQVVGFIPALILALLKAMENDQNFGQIVLLVFLVMAVVQVIQETILIPRIMGKAYNMNPAVILLSLSVWGSIMGILGMLLALPLTTMLFSYYKQFVLKEDDSKKEIVMASTEIPNGNEEP